MMISSLPIKPARLPVTFQYPIIFVCTQNQYYSFYTHLYYDINGVSIYHSHHLRDVCIDKYSHNFSGGTTTKLFASMNLDT